MFDVFFCFNADSTDITLLVLFFFFRIQTLQHQAYSIVTVTKLNLTNEARLRKTYIFLMDFFHSVDNVVPDMI